jgi:predicted AAA+ superfamily ATPase
MLAQLAWDCLQSSRDAVGENDELTRELLGLYKSLSRLQNELANPTSLVNRANDERRQELEEHAANCEGILKVMNTVLEKYNALGREQRKRMRLWQRIKFGNGEVKDLR